MRSFTQAPKIFSGPAQCRWEVVGAQGQLSGHSPVGQVGYMAAEPMPHMLAAETFD